MADRRDTCGTHVSYDAGCLDCVTRRLGRVEHDLEHLRLGPRAGGPTPAEIEAACEAFLVRWSAGTTDDAGRTGLARDIAAALGAAKGHAAHA